MFSCINSAKASMRRICSILLCPVVRATPQRLFNIRYTHTRRAPFSTEVAKVPAIPTPDQFDVLFTDIDNYIIHSSVAPKLGVQYLGDSINPPSSIPIQKKLNCVMIGSHLRVFIALPVQIGMTIKDVVFLVDTGAPFTYLSNEALKAFQVNMTQVGHRVSICGGHPISVRVSRAHFADVCLLGTDVLDKFGAQMFLDYVTQTATLIWTRP